MEGEKFQRKRYTEMFFLKKYDAKICEIIMQASYDNIGSTS